MNASSPTAEPRGPNFRAYTTTKVSVHRTTMASQGSFATSRGEDDRDGGGDEAQHEGEALLGEPRSLTDALVHRDPPPTMARITWSPYGRPNARRITAEAASATAARSAVRAAKPPGSRRRGDRAWSRREKRARVAGSSGGLSRESCRTITHSPTVSPAIAPTSVLSSSQRGNADPPDLLGGLRVLGLIELPGEPEVAPERERRTPNTCSSRNAVSRRDAALAVHDLVE